MWARETCAEVLAIVHKAGIKKFRVSDMTGCAWIVDKTYLCSKVNSCQSRYVLYRIYVEDYKVWLEVLVD